MNAPGDIHERVAELKSKGEAFAIATVVRTLSVTSAKAGAKAIILGDGTLTEGWIGGGCARMAVLKAAREAIEDGAPRFVSVQPEDLLDEQGVAPGDIKDGIKYARSLCPSKGSMEIFVEAVRPKPELVIMGSSPVAVALAALAKPMGLSRTICAPETEHAAFSDADLWIDGLDVPSRNARRFIVVSTQGRGDEAALKSALSSHFDYAAFVGSARKAESLTRKLRDQGIAETQVDRLKAPAGLDIKAITPEEIALSILAEIVERRRAIDRDVAVCEPTQAPSPQQSKRSSGKASLVSRLVQKMSPCPNPKTSQVAKDAPTALNLPPPCC